jgi:hypothetical protein
MRDIETIILNRFFSSQIDRGNYTPAIGYLSYFSIYIGGVDEDLYNYEIFKTSKLIKNRKDIILFTNGFSDYNDVESLNHFRSCLNEYENSIEDLDLELISNESMNFKIKKSLDSVLNDISLRFNNNQEKIEFISQLLMCIKEFIGYIKIDKNESPKVLYYGQPKENELLFMLVLFISGFDIMCLSPNKKINVDYLNIDKYKIEVISDDLLENVLSFEERNSLGKTTDEKSIKKTYTVGAKASKKISNELLEDTGFIKPWQLQDRMVKNLLLSTTIDEISIYWNEQVNFRPGFSFNKEIVNIPVFFSKISGVYNDESEYTKLVNNFMASDQTYFIEYEGNDLVFSKDFTKDELSLSYFILGNELDKKEIIKNNIYSISMLDVKIQNVILNKIEEIFDGNLFLGGLSDEDKVKGLNAVLNMDSKLVRLLNNFDYSRINPKLVLFIGKNFNLRREVCFLMTVLSKLGFDIVILTPGGENNIENTINRDLIDYHRLDKMEYDAKLDNYKDNLTLTKKEIDIKKIKNIRLKKGYLLVGVLVLSIVVGGKYIISQFSVEQNNQDSYADETIYADDYDEVDGANDNKEKGDIGEVATPFKAEDIIIEEYKRGKKKVQLKTTNNSKIPIKDILASIEYNDGESTGYYDVYSTIMPGKSRVEVAESPQIIKKVHVLSAHVTWIDDEDNVITTNIDFQLGTTESYIN